VKGQTVTDEQRQEAIQRIRAKRGFWRHFATYLAVNALLVAIWAMTSGSYFWPIWPILGWGIGVAANAAGVFLRPNGISEERIEREMQGRRG
jgi:hypothetical protein